MNGNRRKALRTAGAAAVIAWLAASASAAPAAAPIRPVSFADVTFEDSLWAARQETNRRATIPHVLGELKRRGSLSGFAVLAGEAGEPYRGYMWADSDVYKTLEGIAASLRTSPDPSLEKEAERIIGLIVRAQAADGYLMPHLQIAEPGTARYADETTRTCESYSQGHLIESAVAHHETTGRREYLEAAIRTADLLARVHAEGKLEQISGHPGIEIALVKLARATGDDKYLELARSYVANARAMSSLWSGGRPFLADDEPAGHAVAACYLYAGATDVAALTGDTALLHLLEAKWEKMVGRKLYVTGGIGLPAGEAFGPDHELLNERAYCETCAAISAVFWSHRLFLASGDARYVDLVERVFHNGLLAGVSLGGDRFFYVNPLASRGDHHRQPWHGCACCPTNVVRFLPALGQYVYASTDA
ncbi:MAG: glycoside hydrolase family 127 protein, partial [Planctomycetes bacterium]|nr:glycoside hydrolase family 127 protein [Planctomycetota bacterium]